MVDARQDLSLRCTIAFQFVRDDAERCFTLSSHQSAKKSLRCELIAARLQQNIDDITILIHGTPKILLPAVDSDEEFVQMPSITEASLFLLKTSGIVGPEFPAPLSDGFFLRKYIPASVVNYSLKSRLGASGALLATSWPSRRPRGTHRYAELAEAANMVPEQALLLLLGDRLAAPFFIRCAALQNKISELQKIVGHGDDGNRTAPLGRAFSGNPPELVAQVARLHLRNSPGTLG